MASQAAQCKAYLPMQETGFDPWVGKGSSEKEMATLQYSCWKIPCTEEAERTTMVHGVSKEVRHNSN